MTTLSKAQTLDNKIVALRLQIEKLEAQRQQAAFEDKLLPGAVVSYMSARSANAGQAKIVAISTNAAGRDARYTARINEGTADETTRQLRFAEITGVITEAPTCH